MYIIVVGGGTTGQYLSAELLAHGHEALIVEKNRQRYEELRETLGCCVVRGDGCEAATLAEAGAERAQVFIAVTPEDEDNLVACQVAKHRFHVTRTIALLNNPRNARLFEELGIDSTVSKTSLVLASILQELPGHPFVRAVPLRGQGLELLEARVPHGSPLAGRRLAEVGLPEGCTVSLVVTRHNGPVVPDQETVLQPDDWIVAVGKPGTEAAFRAALTTPPAERELV